MCTAITLSGREFYFGRTLDLERTYGEEVVITPRNYPLPFTQCPDRYKHYAIIGMAHVADNYPLYYDAVNEAGLCMAALRFSGFARYGTGVGKTDRVACFEFIPWLLGQCESVARARDLLERLQLTDTPFGPDYPTAELHWIIADRNECVSVESMEQGLRVFDNPVGVLTNTPPFDDQMFQLRNFMHLSPNPPENHFSQNIELTPYSRGMGALGLPGDLSSQSRFVRAAFTRLNSQWEEGEEVSQFFHILGAVNQIKGCCRLADGSCERTLYTSCCNADRGVYYYTTYGNRRISAVQMHRENLEQSRLLRFPLTRGEDIRFVNE